MPMQLVPICLLSQTISTYKLTVEKTCLTKSKIMCFISFHLQIKEHGFTQGKQNVSRTSQFKIWLLFLNQNGTYKLQATTFLIHITFNISFLHYSRIDQYLLYHTYINLGYKYDRSFPFYDLSTQQVHMPSIFKKKLHHKHPLPLSGSLIITYLCLFLIFR